MSDFTYINNASGNFVSIVEYAVVSATTEAVASTLATGIDMFIKEVRLHLSAAATTAEDFTITVSNANAKLNFKLLTQAMAGVQDVIWVSDSPTGFFLAANQSLVCAYTNTDTRTWGLSIVAKVGN